VETQYFKWYSPNLDREMECKVYGHAGRPVLFIPCQDGRFFDFENFHMTDTWSPWLESGQVMVCATDTMDAETWSNKTGDPAWRARRHEQWMDYITREVVPFLRDMVNRRNGWEGYPGVLAFGCSLGATHAVNLYFRYPDLFDSLLALSGIYSADYGFDGYMDEIVYRNSPVHYLEQMPADHPFIAQYNQHKGVICVGQGAWEAPETTHRIQALCQEKGIHLWVDFWGYDVNHDWVWWHKQVAYFVPYLLG
jgi:esterase/lipase superfamily enzyme